MASFGGPDVSVLLVIAHPDDESMFFGPTLQQLALNSRTSVSILCLSTGDAAGLGSVRRIELVKAGLVFGLPPENITIIEDTRLQDGMTTKWDESLIQSLVQNEIVRRRANTVLTFDSHGVSGHPNHRSTHYALMELFANGKVDARVQLWILETPNPLRKFLGLFDIPIAATITWLERSNTGRRKILISGNVLVCWRAMIKHWSQFLWFRMLFLIFSSFTYANTLLRVF